MNKIIKYFEETYFDNHVSNHFIKSYNNNPEKLEDLILFVIKYYKEQNKSLEEMFITHMDFCTSRVFFRKD